MSSSVNCKDHEEDRTLWPNLSQAGLDDKADIADVLVLSEVFLGSAEALSASIHPFKQGQTSVMRKVVDAREVGQVPDGLIVPIMDKDVHE